MTAFVEKIKDGLVQVGWFLYLPMILVVGFGPLVQHVLWCIERADETGSAIALLIVGLIFFPVGWVHGVSVILGFGGWV